MKKIISFFACALLMGHIHAQQWNGSATSTGLLYRDGNTVIGSTVLYGGWGASDRVFQVIGNNSALALFSNAYSGNYILGFFPQYNYSGIITPQHPLVMSVGGTERMRISTAGAVTIGSVPATPAGYKLYVEQGILAEKVKVAVKTSADWSDYVFEKNYSLMPLDKLAAYIHTHKHLPGVPSAQQVVKEGIDLGKMDAKLLEKIEELTLYIIELKKENEAIKKELEAQKNNKTFK